MCERSNSQNNQLETILSLSKLISIQRGKNEDLDPQDVAISKLTQGDTSKKHDDRGEIDEIKEELLRDPIDLIALAGEIADFIYYRVKIKEFPADLEKTLLIACGFDGNSALQVAVTKYTARTNANSMNLPKNEREKLERRELEELLKSNPNILTLSNINPELGIQTINRIKLHLLQLVTPT